MAVVAPKKNLPSEVKFLPLSFMSPTEIQGWKKLVCFFFGQTHTRNNQSDCIKAFKALPNARLFPSSRRALRSYKWYLANRRTTAYHL
ncbi:hypothetical protein VP01_7774g1 [Puccinia sorghi]|uniref:Uncharacterized protein n=1 Tax=Puccinia sorghi TaxID=27349 RepID=A0A0L6UC47_9BASI|nr:hypothetical protein VP01_7774g1 [Puccinia sorghi]